MVETGKKALHKPYNNMLVINEKTVKKINIKWRKGKQVKIKVGIYLVGGEWGAIWDNSSIVSSLTLWLLSRQRVCRTERRNVS